MSDFERTCGAGARLDSIIEGYSSRYLPQEFDTKWIDFHHFDDAMAFAKKWPGSVVARQDSESKRIPSKDFAYFRVTPVKEVAFFRVSADMLEAWGARASPQFFKLSVSTDIDHGRCLSAWFGEEDVTRDSLHRYFTNRSSSECGRLVRKPYDLETIKANLKKRGLELSPLSEFVCRIGSIEDQGNIEVVLFTEDDVTWVIGCLDNGIRDLLC
jgi:hypothetical protein